MSPNRPAITSPSNPEIKSVAALRRRSEREDRGLFLIEGEAEISRAARAGIDIDVLYSLGDITSSSLVSKWRVVSVSEQAMARIAYGRDGLVAVARIPGFELSQLELQDPALVLVVESLEKPGNLGAVLRSADATGAAVIVADQTTDITNPNVVRASLGTLFTVPVAVTSIGDAIAFLADRGVILAATTVDGGIPPWEANLTRPTAIIIGSEARGVSEESIKAADLRLTIPMSGTADSLNASVTAGVVLYEAIRQRSKT